MINQDKLKNIPCISKSTLNITDKEKRLDSEIIGFYNYVIQNDYEKEIKNNIKKFIEVNSNNLLNVKLFGSNAIGLSIAILILIFVF